MYHFKLNAFTNLLYFYTGENYDVCAVNILKVQEHTLLGAAVLLINYLNAFKTPPSEDLIKSKFKQYLLQIQAS